MTIGIYAMTNEPRLFVGLLGQAPDGVHFANYAYGFEAGDTPTQVAEWMFYDYQPQFYPSSMTHAQVATKFYTNVYGRAPDASALAYWQGKLDAWESAGSVLAQMIDGLVNYTGSDTATLQSQALFNNRVAVALYYAEYGGNDLGVSAVLQGVTSDPASVLTAIHAMKGHWNIPADAADPSPAPTSPAPAPAPAPAPDPVVEHGLPDHADQLAQLYLAYFGRPMDWSGIDFYAGHGSLDLFALAPSFSTSPESAQLYGTTFGAAQVNAIYQNLFNRDAEAAGVTFWTNAVNSGKLDAASAALSIMLGAQNDDKVTVANKLQVALAFSAHVDTQAEVSGYSGANAAAAARDFLHSVDSTSASVTAAMQQLDHEIATIVGLAPHDAAA